MANLIIYENEAERTTPAVHGEEITITAPCDCSEVTGVQIAGEIFPFCDACGNTVSGGLFTEGNLIRVLIDAVNTRATIINRGITPAQIGALPISGGEMTGILTLDAGLKFNNGIQICEPLRTAGLEGDTSGSAVTLGAGGITIVGGGEAATNLYNALKTNDEKATTYEQLHLAADKTIHIHTNCNTIASRQTIDISTTGAITVPANTDYTTKKARNIYAGTTAMTAGTTALDNGCIYLQYE